MSEVEVEPVPGLPEQLPAGEHILWQGQPDWRLLERTAFHVRGLTVYFGVFTVVRGISELIAGESLVAAAFSSLLVVPLALLALGLIRLFAWLNARSTIYTITNRRVVMRFGVALPTTFNLPFPRLASADLKPLSGGAGEIAFSLMGNDRLAYLQMWPHVRPWRFARTSPMLRALPDGAEVAGILRQAVRT